ncbi:35748_t:CDS:2, partial [Gigaspora margarita]
MSLQNIPVILSKASKRNLHKKDLRATKKAKIKKPVSSITNEVNSISHKRENIFYNPLKDNSDCNIDVGINNSGKKLRVSKKHAIYNKKYSKSTKSGSQSPK